jgi:signal transduction histidine kinase
MTDNKGKSDQASKLVTSLAAGLALGAATVYLSDKKNQKKVAKKLDEVRSWSDKNVAQWKEKGDDLKGDALEIKGKVEEGVMDKVDEVEKEVSAEINREKSLKADKKKI